MRILLVFLVLFTLSGCASVARDGSVYGAYNSFEKGNYLKTITRVEESMSMYSHTDDQKAELLFLKMQSYQKLDDMESTVGILKYLAEAFPKTEHGFRAQQTLKSAGE